MAARYFQGFLLEADTLNVTKSLGIRDADTLSLHPYLGGPAVSQIRHNGQSQIAYSFVTPFIAHLVRDEPLDQVPWRKFGIQWITQPTPESSPVWITQFTAHGMTGYQHIPRIEVAYAAAASVTLTLNVYDGTAPSPITLPTTGGVYHKVQTALTFNKFMLVQYQAVSASPFRLYLNDWTMWIGPWGRSSPYTLYHNMGGEFGDKVEV